MLLLALALAAGCATTTWAPRSTAPEVALQWPFPPNPAKLTLERSFSGFATSRAAGSTLGAVLAGRPKEDRGGFVLPVAVAIGGDGRIAVADMGRSAVHLYIPASKAYLSLVGSKQDPMASPVGVAFDDAGRLYVTDSTGRLFAFGSDGKLFFCLKQAGSEPLRRPTGIVWSSRSQMLYVVDTLANRVYAFRSSGALEFAFGERGDGSGQFNFPTHIVESPAGELYVCDALNFRVAIFDETGKPLGSFGHHGDGSGDLALPARPGGRPGRRRLRRRRPVRQRPAVQPARRLPAHARQARDGSRRVLASFRRLLSQGGELYVGDTYNRRIQVFRVAENYANAVS